MTASQDTLGKINHARQGIRSAMQALDQIPDVEVPRVTNDGLQHQLRELEQRLSALHDDLAPAANRSAANESKRSA